MVLANEATMLIRGLSQATYDAHHAPVVPWSTPTNRSSNHPTTRSTDELPQPKVVTGSDLLHRLNEVENYYTPQKEERTNYHSKLLNIGRCKFHHGHTLANLVVNRPERHETYTIILCGGLVLHNHTGAWQKKDNLP